MPMTNRLACKRSALTRTALALGVALLAPRAARAAVTAVCYENMGRVVDAMPLSGTR